MAETRNCTPYTAFVFFFLFYLLVIDLCYQCRGENPDDITMYELTRSLYGVPSNWKPQLDPCTWDDVICSCNRVIAINLAQSGISGSLSPAHGNLTSLTSLQLEFNNICGSLASANSPRYRRYTSKPRPLIPSQDINSVARLLYFSAINTSLTGSIPDFLGSLSSLNILHLSYNQLIGPLLSSFAGSVLAKLFLDHQQSCDKIFDRINVIGAMPQLTMV
ncbi:hypothetical protein ZIOFF_046885 [Zingiber officinale]|uniref:Leucine-rich repeat-containing N-terminal plant-type domain-containing protein n=1 Tax=Zingiber officinale TaxID=94328 RepID=A0A8J5KW84_ZINOF|nr:hypothetical protein ZIOFF_046885 [Zingiber officinale]